MYYYYPGNQFPAISVTGTHCEVMCLHCKGHYLKSMVRAETPDKLVEVCKQLDEKKAVGCLISGGCDHMGRVPLPLDAVRRIREETDLILNLHTGLVDETTVDVLTNIDPYISFEVPTPFALHHVHQLNVTQEEYFNSLELLEGLKIIPHVMVGLEKEGERETMKTLEKMGFSSLVLIVFTPTKGTPLEKRLVDMTSVIESIEVARELFPRLVLGCMRPRVRELEECICLFDGVVLPTQWAREKVEQQGVPVKIRNTCCVVE